MNKNPNRPNDISNIISKCLNPTTEELRVYWERQEQILKEVFGE